MGGVEGLSRRDVFPIVSIRSIEDAYCIFDCANKAGRSSIHYISQERRWHQSSREFAGQ